MAGCYEVWLIAEGAQEGEATFPERSTAEEWARQAIADCEDEGVQAEAYILHHAHAEDGEECCCLQWAQDYAEETLQTVASANGKEGEE